MGKPEIRAHRKFVVLADGLSAVKLHNNSVKVLKDSAPAFSSWTLEFKRDCPSVMKPVPDDKKSVTTQ